MDRFPDSVVTRLESSPEQMAAAVVGQFPPARSEVRVVEYDHEWPSRFGAVSRVVEASIGAVALRIEHVGSTSVPGLAAKPIIDVDVTVDDADDEAAYVGPLEAVGMRLVIREPWWHGHRMFVDAAGDVNLHVWPEGAAEPIRHLLFRDWLRSHPEDRELYARSKRELGRELSAEPHRYNLAKNAVIDDIYARIFAAGPAAS